MAQTLKEKPTKRERESVSSVCVSARDREREKIRQRERANEWMIPMVWFTIGAESAKRFAA